MAKAYHIVQWQLYESSETRKVESMPWFKKRTKLVGLGIGKLMRQPFPRNMELFGIWTVLETLATQSSPQFRGWLVRDMVPLDPDGMSSLVPTVPAEAFKSACDWFTEHLPGWLKLENFPGSVPTTGTPSGDSPGSVPTTGTPSGDSPGSVPTTGTPSGDSPQRERDRESTERKKKERGAPGGSPEIPPEEEVRAWARLSDVDEAYALSLWHGTTEKHGWIQNGRLIQWRERFLRFWEEDRDKFQKKNGGALAARPNAWKDGDQEWWWAAPVESVEAALHGAALGKDKKTGGRLKEILEKRKNA